MTPETKDLIRYCERMLPECPYQEAVDLGRLAEWWRDVALCLLAEVRRLREREIEAESTLVMQHKLIRAGGYADGLEAAGRRDSQA